MTGKRIQIAVPTTILLITTQRILAEIVGAAVTLGVAVSKLIAELQEGSLPEWFTIGQLACITVILRRSQVITVGLISRILTLCSLHEIELGIVERDTLAIFICIFGIHFEGDVAALVAQLAVDLQHTVDIVIIRVSDAVGQLAVYHSLRLVQLINTFLRKRVFRGDGIRILVIGSRLATTQSIAGTPGDGRTEKDIGHGIRHPLQSDVTIPTVAARETLAQAIAERAAAAHEVLAGTTAPYIAIAMVPAEGGIEFELVLQLVVVVGSYHLAGIQTIGTAEASTRSTTTESTVAGIIGISKEHESVIVIEITTHTTHIVSALVTNTQVDVGHQTLVHTLLHTEVEHGLFLAIIDTGYLREVTLLIVSLNLVDDAGRQVLQGSLGITRHKLLAIHENLLHFLTIDFDGTVVADLCTRQTLDEFLYHRTFRCTVGSRIIDEGILLQVHLLSHGSNHGTFQHNRLGTHHHLAHRQILVIRNLNALHGSLITYTRHFE